MSECPSCNPAAFPSAYFATEPVNAGHFSVRFGHHYLPLSPFINGVQGVDIEEVMCGSDGWAIAFDYGIDREPGEYPYCPVHRTPKRRVMHGDVRVESVAAWDAG